MGGKPLSFCVNGGSCLKEVTSEEEHAGCTCPEDWIGPHCELKKAPNNEILNENTLRKQPKQNSAAKSKVTILVTSIIAFISAAAITITLIAKKHHKNPEGNNSIQFGNGFNDIYRDSYRDEPFEHSAANLAPRQDSNVDPFPKRFSSNETPIMNAMTMAPSDSTPEANQVQIQMGPPREENCHRLHQVDI